MPRGKPGDRTVLGESTHLGVSTLAGSRPAAQGVLTEHSLHAPAGDWQLPCGLPNHQFQGHSAES